MGRLSRIDWSEWFPKLLAAAIMLFTVVFWAFTNRVEPLFVTTAGGLLAIGQVGKARGQIRRVVSEDDSEGS